MRIRFFAVSVLLLVLSTGCGDSSRSVGEFGRLSYSLHSDFLVDGTALVGTSILTGHSQRIRVSLTSAGEAAIADPGAIEHSVSGPTVAVVETLGGGSQSVGDLEITVQEPGDYVLSSMNGGQVFDRLTLTFDRPETLEFVTWVREPDGTEFTEAVGSPVAVAEGAQAAFVPIPLDGAGERIAGDFVPLISPSPDWAVVTGTNIFGIYEQRVVASGSPASVYFVASGTVSVRLIDEPNDAEGEVEFSVAPAGPIPPPG
jgi:hypothetical protein